MTAEKSTRSHWLTALLLIAVAGAMGFGIFAVMLRNWTAVRSFDEGQAQVEIQAILDGLEDSRPYILLNEDGSYSDDPGILHETPVDIGFMGVVTWNPEERRWLQTTFPFWFVRLKLRHGIPIGPLRMALEEDWAHLSFDRVARHFERRGPGLILHHVGEDGRQILIWNSAPIGR